MSLTAKWIAAQVRRLAIPVLLIVYLTLKLVSALILGDAPEPQSPPDGYEVQTPEVRMVWHSTDWTSLFVVKIIEQGGDFDHPLLEKKTRSNSLSLPNLDRGRVYCWQVEALKSGRMSRTACFRLSPYRIVY
ncbi:MAG: hypothetical protein GXP49_10520 [Deltaproteobacteria bacterium]|nr:hypothetical protein [Deltaproteobacteria bacterium]